ncbi:MAG TPA: hypothetical protein VGH99_24040 [Pseudonocardia sp.]|jgi:virginiamycin B lyase
MTGGYLGRLGVEGTLTTVPLPDAGGMPAMITSGPDGAQWLTLNAENAVGRLDPHGHRIDTHPLPTGGAGPVGIAADRDVVWFAEFLAGRVGRISPDGAIEEWDLPDRASKPHAVAPDGAGGCWATLWGSGELAYLDATGGCTVTALGPAAAPHGLAVVGSDVWVALESCAVVRVGPA